MAKTLEEKKLYLAEYYKKNSAKIKARSHARYHANPEEAIAKQKENRKKNPETHLKNNRSWRKKNLEKARESGRAWAKNNPEYRRQVERKRRALKKTSIVVPYTEAEVLTVYGTSCHICLKEINLNAERRVGRKGWEFGLHIDHLIPIVEGGPDSLENVRPAHGLCNLKKGRVTAQYQIWLD